jgi:carbon storage regulator
VVCSRREDAVLTFTRKTGQAIRIGDSIVVTVTEVRGRQVRLHIEAPREISVFREELYRQIAEENEKAARVEPVRLKELE